MEHALRRRLVRTLAAMAVIAAALAVGAEPAIDWALDARYHATLPRPDGPPPASEAEATRADLLHFRRLPDVDRSFSTEARAEFERRVDAMLARSATLSRAELAMGVSAAAALADNGHTNVGFRARRDALNSSPIRLAWFVDGLFVIRAMPAQRDLLGAKVLTIDGIDPAVLDRESRRFIGGTPEHAHAWNTILLESPQALHALRSEAPDDRLMLRVLDAAGATRVVELPALAPGEGPGASVPARLLSPVPLRKEPGDWATLLDGDRRFPESLREPRERLYWTTIGAARVLYIHLWDIYDDERGPVGDAIDAALGPPSDPPWRRIVLDLRFDGGGDYTTTYDAIRRLPRRLASDGRLVILTDNTTFSAALVTAAWAKHFGGRRAIVVGEKLGDRMTFWAEGVPVELPNSKLAVSVATGYHDWAAGCRELRCFWLNYYYDVPAGSLDPDVVVGWRFDDYRRGIDTVLERALAL